MQWLKRKWLPVLKINHIENHTKVVKYLHSQRILPVERIPKEKSVLRAHMTFCMSRGQCRVRSQDIATSDLWLPQDVPFWVLLLQRALSEMSSGAVKNLKSQITFRTRNSMGQKKGESTNPREISIPQAKNRWAARTRCSKTHSEQLFTLPPPPFANQIYLFKFWSLPMIETASFLNFEVFLW